MKSKLEEEFKKDYEGFKEGVGEIVKGIKVLTRKKHKGHKLPVKRYKFGSMLRW